MTKKNLQVVGIMSGTSLDGVDFVLCRVQSPNKVVFLDKAYSPFPLPLYQQLLKATKHHLLVNQLAELDFNLGRFYAKQLLRHQRQRRWKIHLIGLHGQTVYHLGGHATLQIGKPNFLAAQIKVPVVSDFRSMDIALGGQGAPLATLFHKEVLRKAALQWLSSQSKKSLKNMEAKHIAIQNIGGIANVTSIFKKSTVAYDIGPGNTLIDNLIYKITDGKSHYDQHGKLAFCGIPNSPIIKKWLKSSWVLKKPPKSFDCEKFKTLLNAYLKDLKGHSQEDQIATLTDFTAQLIVRSYRIDLPCLPDLTVLCGGGALNDYLVHRIKYALSDNKTSVISSEDLGWPIQAVEGGAFALLAAYCYWQKPTVITTRKFQKAILGHLTYPS